jgi:hypothetical protein
VGLSVLARGTMTERLEWAFNLYDINRDGLITREEMLNIISAIYELMGRFCEPPGIPFLRDPVLYFHKLTVHRIFPLTHI